MQLPVRRLAISVGLGLPSFGTVVWRNTGLKCQFPLEAQGFRSPDSTQVTLSRGEHPIVGPGVIQSASSPSDAIRPSVMLAEHRMLS